MYETLGSTISLKLTSTMLQKLKLLPIWVTIIGLSAMLFCNKARAQISDTDFPVFSFNGYGTMGLAHSSERNADFILSDLQYEGAGFSQSWSPDVDSRIGAQLTARFNSQLSSVLLVTSAQRHDGTYRPQVEWANIKYKFTPDFSVRIGRGVFPSFLLSNYRKVGYAVPWVRAPTELYSLVPISSTDGIEFSYNKQFGKFRNLLSVSLGQGSAKLPEGITFTGKNGWGVSDTLEYGNTTLRASYFRAKQKFENIDHLAAIFDGFRAYGSEGQALADKYDGVGKPLTALTFGASYDPGKWFAMGEWGVVDFRSAYGKKAAWYVSGGYRWGKFTPYISFSKASAKNKTYDPGLEPATYGAGVVALNAGLNKILISAPVQKTVSVGLRWDVTKNSAIKIQYDHTDIGEGSYGTLNNRQSSLETGGKFNVFSVVVDFLF